MSETRPPPQAIVVFGASGDLTRRKVLPALYDLVCEDQMPERFAIVGYARGEWDDDRFREHARKAVEEFSNTGFEPDRWNDFARSLHYVPGPYDTPDCFAPLVARLGDLDERCDLGGRRLYYCATPPSAFPVLIERLGEAGSQREARIVVEKPFGRDTASARELNATIHRVFEESQVFRIDHYLGKETIQNIFVFRFGNAMFERVWHRDAIDHIQITVAESLGVGGRGSFYEQTGAARDMLQSHLLQMLAFLAMEPPRSLDASAIHDEKAKALGALRPFDPELVVRGQYGEGAVDGRAVAAYRTEPDVARDSSVETYVAAKGYVDTWRWDGVPFFLRTGKRLRRRTSEVAVFFREPPEYLFRELGLGRLPANHLSLRIQPHEGISFSFQAKRPGPEIVPETVHMDFSYSEFFHTREADAYERLLHDAMEGDRTLFNREDAVERAWEVVEPLLGAAGPVRPYPAGSWGPQEADALIAPRRWHLRR